MFAPVVVCCLHRLRAQLLRLDSSLEKNTVVFLCVWVHFFLSEAQHPIPERTQNPHRMQGKWTGADELVYIPAGKGLLTTKLVVWII